MFRTVDSDAFNLVDQVQDTEECDDRRDEGVVGINI